MKKNIVLGSLLTFLLASCGQKDCNTACDAIFPEVAFKIQNAGGQNLVSGPAKIYTTDKIKVRTTITGGITVEESLFFKGDSTQAATAINFTATGLGTTYYLYINGIKTDSLQLTYAVQDGRQDCCPQFYGITNCKLNNAATSYVFPNAPGPVIVTK